MGFFLWITIWISLCECLLFSLLFFMSPLQYLTSDAIRQTKSVKKRNGIRYIAYGFYEIGKKIDLYIISFPMRHKTTTKYHKKEKNMWFSSLFFVTEALLLYMPFLLLFYFSVIFPTIFNIPVRLLLSLQSI